MGALDAIIADYQRKGGPVRLNMKPQADTMVAAAADARRPQPQRGTTPIRLRAPQDPAMVRAAQRAARMGAQPVSRPEAPPRATPLSMLGTTSAASGGALGHLADRPGDALGAIRAGVSEAGEAVFQPIEEQTSPSRELQKRGVPMSPLTAIAIDMGLDVGNLVAPEKVLAAGMIPASVRRVGGIVRRGASEAVEAARSRFQRVPGVSDVLERGGQPAGVDLTPKPLGPAAATDDAARIDAFIGRHVLINPHADRLLINAILEKGRNFVGERGRVQTWEQTGAMADDIVVDLSKTLPKGAALSAADTEALRRTAMGLVNVASERAAAIRAAGAAGEGVSLAQRADALQAMQEATIGIQSLLGARGEAGRTLNLYKKLVKARQVNDIDFVKQALEAGADTVKAAEALATMPDALSRYRFLRDLAKPSKQDYWRWYYLTNLLSAPVTQIRNIAGNSTKTVTDLMLPLADLQGREAVIGAVGAWQGIKTGWQKAAFMFKEGFSLDDAERLAERGPEVAIRGNRLLPNVVQRGMEAGDQFFRTINAEAAAHQGAFRRVRAQGMKPGTEAFNAAVARMLADRPSDLIEEMARAGAEGVFRQEPGKALRKTQELRRAADEVMADFGDWVEQTTGSRALGTVASMPVGTFVLPFIQTPANILKAGAAYSPYGALKGQLTGDARLARQGRLGSLMLAYPAMLAAEGRLTGSGPSDPTEREQWYAEGKQPNSIKIGNTWHSYSQVQPLATPLALVANAFELYRQTGQAPDVGGIVFKLGNSVLQQSYLSSALALAEAVNDPEEKGSRWLGRTLAGFVPASSLVRSVGRVVDPTVRSPQGAIEHVKVGIPGLAQTVPERIDYAGEPIRTKGGPVSRFLNPVYSSPESTDPLRTTLRETGARLTRPSDRLQGLPMTQEQRAALAKATGRGQAAAMRQIIASPAFQSMPQEQQVAELEKAASDARAGVRGVAREALEQFIGRTVAEYRTTRDPQRKRELRTRIEEMRASLPQ